MTIEKHPNRYPVHKNSDKGQVFGGECNRTRCNHPHATAYNKMTFDYYCSPWGRSINGHDPRPLCVEVDHQLSRDEQDEAYRNYQRAA